MKRGGAAHRALFSARNATWIGIGLVAAGTVVPGASCAPIEQLVVGELAGEGGAAPRCTEAGAACGAAAECCSGVCDAATGRCGESPALCRPGGQECVTPLDCCGLSCLDGVCLDDCRSDGEDCGRGEECCSGRCTGGTCTPLSGRCSTAGNACASSADCCSGLCDGAGRCSLSSSYCVQPDDVCRAGSDCCTGVCELDAGAELGTCGTTPMGASNCAAGVAGLLCTNCNQCCSRLCAPYGASGTEICMPASGCRVTGEICREDADCCGGDPESGLPGAGTSGCDKAEGAEVGVCRNPMGCSPVGNVCHMMDYACSVSAASNRCCDGSEPGACVLDAAGIPRCGLPDAACRLAGEPCATTEDCCEGALCVPGAMGLSCHAGSCREAAESCVTQADCCDGSSCVIAVGASAGVCVSREP